MEYTLSQIANICGGVHIGDDNVVRSITTDSRTPSCSQSLSPLFLAMKGVNHDSHCQIEAMYLRGVRSFIVEREDAVAVELVGAGYVVVKSAIDALQMLAADYRTKFKGEVVAITGSNAKTIIKEWISESLPSDLSFYRSPKSFNSQLGVALSMLMIGGDEKLAIIEAGISEPNEMARLERMIKPDVVIFTSIGDAHQENFESLEQKICEKLILARDARRIIYHGFYESMAAMIESQFGDRELVDCQRITPPSSVIVPNAAQRRNGQIVGGFVVSMGYEFAQCQRTPTLSMRLEVKDGINNSLVINDAYSLDLNSLALALDYLHTLALNRGKTLILSDVSQSGYSSDELYHRVAELVARGGVDWLIGVGGNIAQYGYLFGCKCQFFETTEQCVENIDRAAIADRAILIKGGRNFRFERIAHRLEKKSHTTTLEVDLDAMVSNLNYFRHKMDQSTKLVAMVKASSYGAGAFEIAQELQYHGVDYLAVAFADEGVVLREKGISLPIVVLNADADSFDQMVAYRLEPEIYSIHSLRCFVEAVGYGERDYPIHIKLDTGMHRLGFEMDQLDELVSELGATSSLRVASLFSHLSCSDVVGEEEFTRSQIDLFERMTTKIGEALGYMPLRHIANSAAIERFPEAHYDMCRLGLGLYGFGYEHNDALTPISTLKTRIVQLKHYRKGDRIGYGHAGLIERDSVVATIPIGYADGVDRRLGCGVWSMVVDGRMAPIVGRVCMDSCMVDVTDCEDVREGDGVLIFSPLKGNTAEDMAAKFGTIPYEIMTSVSERVKRIYIKA